MPNPTTRHFATMALAATLACSAAAGWDVYQSRADPVASATMNTGTLAIVPASVPMPPAKPQLKATRAWEMIGPQVQASPWLSRADETAAWIDQAGNDAQQTAAAVSEKLRELSLLMNEHWAGQLVCETLKGIAQGTAVLSPDLTMKAMAIGMVHAVDHADEWSLALAQRTDEVADWIESFTEPYERYATAYRKMTDEPTAANYAEWAEASQALLPHLEQAQVVCAQLNKHLATVNNCLTDIHNTLDSADHWTVDWLASRIDGAMIEPSIAKLTTFQTQVHIMQARATYDQGLVASLPDRFVRYEIVD